ncbi:unnamed protein product [Adineta steineri]|uniref:Carrier domain-containing protein n=1 Tax=Adineta steineri TaxID=433720 RepID=A0A816A0T8_9BILA|nr:unnamed protein product [Adineta steineri]CAF1589503.1 unnamed protein product [Adineta steineri]
MDPNDKLYSVGGIGFQKEFRDPRVELGEIERTILNASSSVTNCVVIKYQQQPGGQEHLITYVQSSSSSSSPDEGMITIKELKHICQQYLSLYMMPIWFVILEQLPLDTNGKVDHKQLPTPDLSQLTQQHDDNTNEPKEQIHTEIHTFWNRLLSIDKLSMKSNFFSIGGNSLLLVKLYNYYLSRFSLNQQIINLAMLYKQPTIIEHIQLVKNALLTSTTDTFPSKKKKWKPLNIMHSKL